MHSVSKYYENSTFKIIYYSLVSMTIATFTTGVMILFHNFSTQCKFTGFLNSSSASKLELCSKAAGEKRQTIFNFRTLCKLPSINLTLGSIPIQKSANGSGINTEFFCLQYPKRWIGWHETQHGDFGLAQSLEEGRGRNLAGLR